LVGSRDATALSAGRSTAAQAAVEGSLGLGLGDWLAFGEACTPEGVGAGPPQAVTSSPSVRTNVVQRVRPRDETIRDDVA
jgi:hypothetical protein